MSIAYSRDHVIDLPTCRLPERRKPRGKAFATAIRAMGQPCLALLIEQKLQNRTARFQTRAAGRTIGMVDLGLHGEREQA